MSRKPRVDPVRAALERPAEAQEATQAELRTLTVARATRRPYTLSRATGLPVIAVAAGSSIHPDADHVARTARLCRVLDG